LKENNNNSGKEENSNPSEPPDGNNQLHICETIEDGTEAFMQWMGSSDKKSLTSDNPIVLIKFVNDVHTVLYDTILGRRLKSHCQKGYRTATTVLLMSVDMLVLPYV